MMRRPYVLGLSLFVAACAMAPVPVQTMSAKAVNAISDARIPAMRVGQFELSKTLPGKRDRSLAVRAATIRPEGGSFSHYLAETVKAQLAAAGRLDERSDTIVSGEIVGSDVGSAIGADSGHGLLAVEFAVHRGDTQLFKKTITVEGKWNSSFIGGVAIPAAEHGYMALYPEIVAKLFFDEDLRRVLKR